MYLIENIAPSFARQLTTNILIKGNLRHLICSSYVAEYYAAAQEKNTPNISFFSFLSTNVETNLDERNIRYVPNNRKFLKYHSVLNKFYILATNHSAYHNV